jgi:hypothetical protein
MGKRLGLTKEVSRKKKGRKKDEENILSKDIDMEDDLKNFEKITDRVEREMSNINFSKSFIKSLKFKPQKYKGNYLPYHLRWIFGNSTKTNEISLVQEIKAIETEIVRLKQIKVLNRDFRKIAGLPYGVSSKICPCCKKIENKGHECPHSYCDETCIRKKAESQFQSLYSKPLSTNRGMGLYNDLSSFKKPKKVYFRTFFQEHRTAEEENNEEKDENEDKRKLITQRKIQFSTHKPNAANFKNSNIVGNESKSDNYNYKKDYYNQVTNNNNIGNSEEEDYEEEEEYNEDEEYEEESESLSSKKHIKIEINNS